MKLQPYVRVLLIVIAAAVAGLTAIQDQLPEWVQGVIVGLSAVLAGAGVIPPQVPTSTVVNRRDGEAGYSVIEMLFALILLIVAIIVIFALLDRL
jgi:predicted cation transporter